MFNFLNQGEVTLADVEKCIKELPLPEKIKAIAIYKRYKQIRKIQEKMNLATKVIQKEYLKYDEPVLKNMADIANGKRPILEEELKDLDKYLTEDEKKEANKHLEAHRIEGYWSKCLSSHSIVKNSMGTDDENLLKFVQNISVDDQEGTDNFTIVFAFNENDYIKNKQLKKRFVVKDNAPQKCEGCEIEWSGKNLTLKEIKKKQKNKKTGQQRVVTKTVKAKSFFNFFTSSSDASNINQMQANEQQLAKRQELETDFQIAGSIVDEIIPYSLEYYLGIEHQEEDMGLGDDDDEDEPESDEEETKKKKNKKSKSKSKSKGKDKKDEKAVEKPECKQQ